ncbi:BrxA family protein [Flavobacterium lindanitolerans]|uniref:BrxA family protein n=1 Tax=Flavobacterium lindanitolerans TaxID=428988 RepID=UPI0031E1ECE1
MQDYRFSLTAASLMVPEFLGLAKMLYENDFRIDTALNLEIKKDRKATQKRELAELKLRLHNLSKKEIVFCTETHNENQKLICLLANVRTYRILREFIEEVILDKIMVYDYQLNSRDFANFMYNKSLLYPEIEALSESTRKKVQQVIFKMLEQAGLLDNIRNKKIQIPLLDFEIKNIISDNDQKYFLNL